MTPSHPPRLPLALLRRYVRDNDPLVGDLIEGFDVSRSRVWFWRQTIAALALHAFRRRDRERPLGLAGPSVLPVPKRQPVGELRPTNLTASPIRGVGGLGLLALAVLVAVVNPQVGWILLPAVAGGLAIGVALIVVRRRSVVAGRAARRPTILG